MQYLTIDDIHQLITPDDLEVLINNDTAKLDRAEQMAVEEVKPYVAVRYDTDVLFTPPLREPLRTIVTDVMLWHLHAVVSPDHIPELRKERYDKAVQWLEKLADGLLNPDFPAKEDATGKPLRYGSGPKFNHYF